VYEDEAIRKDLKKKLYSSGVSRIEIERPAGKVIVNVYVARPGLAIGKKGAGIEQLRADMQAHTKDDVVVNIKEVRKAEIDAQLVAENVAAQLERRIAFRRAMKKAVQSALKFGAQGIKVACSGRLGGAELARAEWYREGRVPLQTLRADIDYGFAEAMTTYGKIGVKTWIYNGEIL
jgi:small subunit ribosomal protein S3